MLLFTVGLLVVVFLLLAVPKLRQYFFVAPLFNQLKRTATLNETERIALEAGDVGWEKDLFSGSPDWKKLQAIQLPRLTEEETAFLNGPTAIFCNLLNDFKIVYEDKGLSQAAWDYLKQERFLGMVIPKAYGGLGFSGLAHSTVVLKIASCSVSAAIHVMVPNSLGPAELLLRYGTEEQKQYYLPRLASGEEIPCFALTGPTAGSDATAMPDSGIVCHGVHNGQNLLGIRLNFDKRYITLAPVATLIGLAFKLYDPDHLLGERDEIGITLCLIPAEHPGIERKKHHMPMGLAFKNGPLKGRDVFIPFDFVIGGQKQLGQGWRMLMECLAAGRGISLPALSTALAQLSYRTTGAYARIRQQFNLPLGEFDGVKEVLGRMGGLTYMMEATRLFTVSAVDRGFKPALASAIAKCHMTEMGRQVINDAMDIHGGRGLQLGPRNYLGIPYIALPISITVEGANLLTRHLIIFGQGALRCHPFLLKEMTAIQESNLVELDKLLIAHTGFFLKNFIKTWVMGLGGSRFFYSDPRLSKPLITYYRQLTRLSSALAFSADIALMMLGKQLKRKECLSARLGDVLSYLYLASSVLRYYQEQQETKEDFAYVAWSLDYCLYKIQSAFEACFSNFPRPFLGKFLKLIVFPFGRSYKCPSDALSGQIASHMQTFSNLRRRLTEYCYIGDRSDDRITRLENALQKILEVMPIEKKLKDALRTKVISASTPSEDLLASAITQNVLTPFEAQQWRDANQARLEAIQVDDF